MRYDLAAVGVRLEDFPSRISWNALWDYVSELLLMPSSHLMSAMQGDKYRPADSERAAYAVFERWLNTQRGSGKGYVKVPRPWAGPKPVYVEDAPEQDRADRRERLAKLF